MDRFDSQAFQNFISEWLEGFGDAITLTSRGIQCGKKRRHLLKEKEEV